MKKTLVLTLLTFSFFYISAQKKEKYDYTCKDVNFTHVHCDDRFWSSRLETARTVLIPYAFRKCEETGRVDNFAIAGGLKDGEFRGRYPFDDSDVFKIMEGASFLLAVKKDDQLDAYLDSLIYLIGKAQEADGYIYTNRTIHEKNPKSPLHPWIKKERWVTEWNNSHETYNAGHMYEAAVAHYLATGKRNFLDIAVKNADLMCKVFNKDGLCVAPGHQVIEMGLVKLYRVTGEQKYLELAHYFLESRGRSDRFDKNSSDMFTNGQYWQDHLPVTQQYEAVGHAVRATYMYAAMTDIAALMNDKAYQNAIDSIWANIVGKKMYITGGIGSTSHGEAFGKNYELPNATAYCETCASISNCMFNHRMFMLYGDAKYIDVLERSLYNGVLSGIDMSGDKFFYPNPLEASYKGQERSPWFDCSCCPSNLARFIPSVPGYMYATDDKSVYVNLFGGNNAEIPFGKGTVEMSQVTDYPWNGNISLTVNPKKAGNFNLKIRIPGWSGNTPVPSDLYTFTNTTDQKVTVKVNGKSYDYQTNKGYAVIKNNWKAGDKVEITIPTEVKKVKANPLVKADRERLAVEYGPIVYCAEFADNNGKVGDKIISDAGTFSIRFRPDLLNGVNTLTGRSTAYTPVEGANEANEYTSAECNLTLIPYYARSHRDIGEMLVWLPDNPQIVIDNVINKHKEAYRIIDEVIIANDESENAHGLKSEKSNSGKPSGWMSGWRDASDGGWFSYDLKVIPNEPMDLVMTYFSKDGGNRRFELFAGDEKVGEQQLRTETFTDMIERKYPIPANVTAGKEKITIKIKSVPGNIAGGVFGCKIQRAEK